MKKDKKQIGWAVLEVLGELVLTLLCMAIGAVIVGMFGVDLTSENTDFDLITLLGLVIFFAILAIIGCLIHWIKKIIKKLVRQNKKNSKKKDELEFTGKDPT